MHTARMLWSVTGARAIGWLPRPVRTLVLLLVVSVTWGRHAGDEAGACGRHEEDRGSAQDDTRRPEAPRAEEVAQDAQRYPHRPSRQIHTCAQGRDDKAARTQEQPNEAADPAQKQLQQALASISLSRSLLHVLLPFFRPLRTQVPDILFSSRVRSRKRCRLALVF